MNNYSIPKFEREKQPPVDFGPMPEKYFKGSNNTLEMTSSLEASLRRTEQMRALGINSNKER